MLLTRNAVCFVFLRLSETDFPVRLLPRVTEAGSCAGVTARCWHGIAAGTPVTAAMGDLQCYVLATLHSDTDAGLPRIGSAFCCVLQPSSIRGLATPMDVLSPFISVLCHSD